MGPGAQKPFSFRAAASAGGPF